MTTFSIQDSAQDGDDNGSWDARTHATYAFAEFFQVFEKDTGSKHHQGGLRFNSVTIAQGATISAATLTVTKHLAPAPDTAFNITVWADDVDDAAVWGAGSRPQNGFTDTTASAVQSTGTGTGTIVWTITTIVQEIVDRAGWVSGNDLKFRLVADTAETYRSVQIVDYDADTTANVAVLEITVSGGGGATGKSNILMGCFGGPLSGGL